MSSIPGRRHLLSARRGELDFPRVNLATYGGRAFAYAGPTSWNSLPGSLKDIYLTLQTFKRMDQDATWHDDRSQPRRL